MEQAKAVSSAEATPEKDATPKKSKRSSINAAGRKSATPKKNGTSVGKIADYLTENSDALLQIPNLRLEAKMVAEVSEFAFVYFFLTICCSHFCIVVIFNYSFLNICPMNKHVAVLYAEWW